MLPIIPPNSLVTKAVDGILNIDKPQGKTSFRVVAAIRRLIGERHVGHGGTLDPQATGVLPVCFGRGTRVTQFLADTTKCYRAEIELGVTTDTYDAWGEVSDRRDPPPITREQLAAALAVFVGEIAQTPPMYSAVKHQGRRLYELARQGISVDRKSRRAVVHSLRLVSWQSPRATIEVVCGKGTYIRSLAHDLGQALGCGAILTGLVRLRCGPFALGDAVSLPELEEAVRGGYWEDFVYPIDTVLLPWTAIVVSVPTADAIRNGRPVAFADRGVPVEERCRAYTSDGSFLGVLRVNREAGQWQPEKVFL